MSESAEKPEIRFVGDLQKLSIGPDDRFVLSVDSIMPREVHDRIQALWADFAGDGVKLLILERGMKLGAINVKVERAEPPPRPERQDPVWKSS